jgi:hypothetical protein
MVQAEADTDMSARIDRLTVELQQGSVGQLSRKTSQLLISKLHGPALSHMKVAGGGLGCVELLGGGSYSPGSPSSTLPAEINNASPSWQHPTPKGSPKGSPSIANASPMAKRSPWSPGSRTVHSPSTIHVVASTAWSTKSAREQSRDGARGPMSRATIAARCESLHQRGEMARLQKDIVREQVELHRRMADLLCVP